MYSEGMNRGLTALSEAEEKKMKIDAAILVLGAIVIFIIFAIGMFKIRMLMMYKRNRGRLLE